MDLLFRKDKQIINMWNKWIQVKKCQGKTTNLIEENLIWGKKMKTCLNLDDINNLLTWRVSVFSESAAEETDMNLSVWQRGDE